MPSNSQYFLRSEVEKLPWIRISILLAMDNPYCRAIVHICRECNKRADVKYFSWCDMHQDTDDDCGKRYTDYYRGYSAREMCHSCFIISRKWVFELSNLRVLYINHFIGSWDILLGFARITPSRENRRKGGHLLLSIATRRIVVNTKDRDKWAKREING